MLTGFLLDTNIVSEAARTRPVPTLVQWLQSQRDRALHIATLTIGEIWRGILEKEEGRRKRELEIWFSGREGPKALFANRVLPFDERAALEWARIMADGKAAGRPRSALDMVIAATAAAHGLVVATANERHFQNVGVRWFNPLTGSGSDYEDLS